MAVEHRDYLLKIAKKTLFNKSLAEDVVQDVLTVMLTRDTSKIKNMKTYLASCVRNLCYRVNKKEERYVTKGLLLSDREFFNLR